MRSSEDLIYGLVGSEFEFLLLFTIMVLLISYPVLRVWDVLLFEGNRLMLFRTALALMEVYGNLIAFWLCWITEHQLPLPVLYIRPRI